MSRYVNIVKIIKIIVVIMGICEEFIILIFLILIFSLNIVIIVLEKDVKFFFLVLWNVINILVEKEISMKIIISLNWIRLLIMICLISLVKKLKYLMGERKKIFSYYL